MANNPDPDLDEIIGQRIDDALTEVATRSDLDEAVAAVGGRVDALTGRVEALEAGTPPPSTLTRIPDEKVIFQIDPSRPSTYGLDRPFGQVEVAGNTINIGDPGDIIAAHLPAEHRAGYGLSMDADGNVHSWPMEDGTTLRYGRVFRADGRPRFRMATQSRPGIDGYDPAANRWFHGWQVNTALDRRPGRSDACTFDGNKTGISGIGANVKTGRGAPVTFWGIAYARKRWMDTTASIAGPFDLHAPGWRVSGQILCSISNGKLIFWSKSSKTDQPIDFDTATNHLLTDITLAEIDVPEPGEEHQLILASRPDRAGGTQLFELFRGDGRGQVEHIASVTTPHGYSFIQEKKNAKHYPKCQAYQWKQHNYPGSPRVRDGHPLWNHDPNYGNVYDLELGGFSVTDEARLGVDWERGVDAMAENIAAMAAGPEHPDDE